MDIVERLRMKVPMSFQMDWSDRAKAADEIEKLRKLLGLAAAAIDFADNAIKQLQQSNSALREALGKKEEREKQMTKYIWPTEGQTFTQLINDHLSKVRFSAKGKKLGRPVGNKNKAGHKAGRRPKTKEPLIVSDKIVERELRSVTLKNLDHSTSTMWLQGTAQSSLNV